MTLMHDKREEHLVEDHNWADACFQSLLDNKFCLLQRALICIHQEHSPVHHAEYPTHRASLDQQEACRAPRRRIAAVHAAIHCAWDIQRCMQASSRRPGPLACPLNAEQRQMRLASPPRRQSQHGLECRQRSRCTPHTEAQYTLN